ncbi:SAM-dependent methyltransferase [Streptomyces boninensis]|uniref:SAM-dependent methyltransferase n=1 Tax=Streptomyces boninensis TaxID=2039455 RepID=UPI003B2243B3
MNSDPRIDPSVPHSARIWNYWLGGKDNYAADRAVGDQVREVYPAIVDVARHSRLFLGRAVRLIAGERGIRQFLDIGTGLPTADNTHEVAQRTAPESRIVYVDNDPLVLTHARALLTSSPEGACAYIDGDAREPEKILAEAARTLDFDRPVGLMLLGALGSVLDDEEAYAIRDRLVAALAPGSYLVFEDGTNAINREAADAAEQTRAEGGDPYRLRDREQMARFLDGLEVLEPGLVSVSRWRVEGNAFREPEEVNAFCAVARKP